MDLDADVAVLAERCDAGVQPDADPHRRRPVVARDLPLCLDRGLRGGLGFGERGEELVAARVDLAAVRRRDRFTQQAPEVGEHGLPALTELACQPRRALDVGEIEGDRSGRERAHPRSVGAGSALAQYCYAATSSSSGLRRAAYAKGW